VVILAATQQITFKKTALKILYSKTNGAFNLVRYFTRCIGITGIAHSRQLQMLPIEYKLRD
jgi:hypothetical protein